MMRKFAKILWIPVLLAVLLWHEAAGAGIGEAGQRCVCVLVPSLYLMSWLAALSAQCGLFAWKKGGSYAILLLSQIGGYPIGAQLVTAQKRMLSEDGVRRMYCLCFGCGPAFLLGTVCRGLSWRVTIVMLLSVSLPQILAGLWLLRHDGMRTEGSDAVRLPFAGCITAAAEQAAASMLKICAMVLLCGAAAGILRGSGMLPFLAECLAAPLSVPAETAEAGLLTLLDVSQVGDFLQSGGTLPAAAALLAFGGFCVHLQNAAIAGSAFPWGRFLLTRLLAGCAAFLVCKCGLAVFCGGIVEANAAAVSRPVPACSSPVPALCLMAMAVMLLMRMPVRPVPFVKIPMKFAKNVDKT